MKSHGSRNVQKRIILTNQDSTAPKSPEKLFSQIKLESEGNLVHAILLDAELAAEALGGVRLALVLLHLGYVVVSHSRLRGSTKKNLN